MPSTNEIIDTKTFKEFLNEVASFCRFMELGEKINTRAFLKLTQTHLQKLYLHGQQLQVVDLNYNKDIDDLLTDTEFKTVLLSISNKLSDKTLYWIVFDPTNEGDTEPVCGDLTDDLGDIYKDLKNALLLFEKQQPAEIENAVWSFKSSFDIHWSTHCINAIYALHYFIQNAS